MTNKYGERMCDTEMKTKKTWEAMSAEERDALVAEEVMGWTDIVLAHPPGGARFPEPPSGRAPWGFSKLSKYTTSLSAAFAVVEKMRESYWQFSCNNNRAGGWDVTFYPADFPSSRAVNTFNRPSLPEAIVLAAIRAKGVEV